MTIFNLPRVADVASKFLSGNKVLNYRLTRIDQDHDHILIEALNLFSVLYCEVTADVQRIAAWSDLQERLYRREHIPANRYLLYLVPNSVVRDSGLFGELARAERDDLLFRKVFVGLPDKASKRAIEGSLEDRIPLWFTERVEVLRQYLPVLEDAVPDRSFAELITRGGPAATFRTIEQEPQYQYLFSDADAQTDGTGVREVPGVGVGRFGRARITGLRIRDFRRFKERDFDLNADVVLVCGRNGTGKTTLCDALELSLFPDLERLHGDPDIERVTPSPYAAYLRVGAATNEALVTMAGISGGDPFEIRTQITPQATTRWLDGKRTTSEELVAWLTRNKNVDKKGFMNILLHTHFLGQHSIRDFIYGNRFDDDQKITTTRYSLVAEMFGFGEVERLKKRLTALLAYIKKAGINEAQRRIDEARNQIRSMQRKYGRKCRLGLEKEGHAVELEYAIGRYRQMMARVANVLGADAVRELETGGSNAEDYLSSCAGIRAQLDAEAKKLQVRDANLKMVAHLVTKLANAVPIEPYVEGMSVTSYTQRVRRLLNDTIASAEQLRRESAVLEGSVKDLGDVLRRLQGFADVQEQYRALRESARSLANSLQIAERRRQDLLKRKENLLLAVRRAERGAKAREDQNALLGARISKYERLADALADFEATREAHEANSRRIAVLDGAIAEAQTTLESLRQEAGSGQDDVEPTQLADESSFRLGDCFVCPCCGMKYRNENDLHDCIQGQLQEGAYREELAKFVADIAAGCVATARKAARESLRIKRREKLALEQTNRRLAEQLPAVKGLAEELGHPDIPSLSVVHDCIEQHAQDLIDLGGSAVTDEARELREEVEAIDRELEELAASCDSSDLGRVQRQIREIEAEVSDVLPEDAMRDVGTVRHLIADQAKKVSQARMRLRDVQGKWKATTPFVDRAEEIGNWVSQIQSVLLKVSATEENADRDLAELAGSNVDKQKGCYRLSAAVEDLAKLFGVLTAQRQSDALKRAIVEYERVRDKWKVCYSNVAGMNTRISDRSYSGLQSSLREYGPLINHVYRKFIRHDYFSDVVLEFKIGRKARRGDLYLRLKSHEGHTEYTPASYLSEAQLNVLALSIFLTRVMYQNISAFDTVFVDDPIQQMDDMNSAAFVDVLLGLSRLGKQIILTTCDHDFYRLVMHKFHDVCRESRISLKTIDINGASA